MHSTSIRLRQWETQNSDKDKRRPNPKSRFSTMTTPKRQMVKTIERRKREREDSDSSPQKSSKGRSEQSYSTEVDNLKKIIDRCRMTSDSRKLSLDFKDKRIHELEKKLENSEKDASVFQNRCQREKTKAAKALEDITDLNRKLDDLNEANGKLKADLEIEKQLASEQWVKEYDLNNSVGVLRGEVDKLGQIIEDYKAKELNSNIQLDNTSRELYCFKYELGEEKRRNSELLSQAYESMNSINQHKIERKTQGLKIDQVESSLKEKDEELERERQATLLNYSCIQEKEAKIRELENAQKISILYCAQLQRDMSSQAQKLVETQLETESQKHKTEIEFCNSRIHKLEEELKDQEIKHLTIMQRIVEENAKKQSIWRSELEDKTCFIQDLEKKYEILTYTKKSEIDILVSGITKMQIEMNQLKEEYANLESTNKALIQKVEEAKSDFEFLENISLRLKSNLNKELIPVSQAAIKSEETEKLRNSASTTVTRELKTEAHIKIEAE